jgi:hypothetical protein
MSTITSSDWLCKGSKKALRVFRFFSVQSCLAHQRLRLADWLLTPTQVPNQVRDAKVNWFRYIVTLPLVILYI